MRFALEIKLGNAAMQTGSDLAEALRGAADYLNANYPLDTLTPHHGNRAVYDLNGNRVGTWEVKS